MNDNELILAGVDAAELRERCMNNERLITMIVDRFLADKTYTSLAEAIARGDMAGAEFACHTLKGVSGNMALKNLYSLTQEQLRLFRAGESGKAVALMSRISAAYDLAAEHLPRFLGRS